MNGSNTSTPRPPARQKADSDAAAQRRSFLHDIHGTFDSDHGQRTLAVLKQSASLHTPATIIPHDGRPIDPLLAAFRDGRKSIVLEIIAWLEEDFSDPNTGPVAVNAPGA